MLAQPKILRPLFEIIKGEKISEIKSETGASLRHNLIVRNLIYYIHDKLLRSCYQNYAVFPSDLRLYKDDNRLKYPDVVIAHVETKVKKGVNGEGISDCEYIFEVISDSNLNSNQKYVELSYSGLKSLKKIFLIDSRAGSRKFYSFDKAETEFKLTEENQVEKIKLDLCNEIILELEEIYDQVDVFFYEEDN